MRTIELFGAFFTSSVNILSVDELRNIINALESKNAFIIEGRSYLVRYYEDWDENYDGDFYLNDRGYSVYDPYIHKDVARYSFTDIEQSKKLAEIHPV